MIETYFRVARTESVLKHRMSRVSLVSECAARAPLPVLLNVPYNVVSLLSFAVQKLVDKLGDAHKQGFAATSRVADASRSPSPVSSRGNDNGNGSSGAGLSRSVSRRIDEMAKSWDRFLGVDDEDRDARATQQLEARLLVKRAQRSFIVSMRKDHGRMQDEAEMPGRVADVRENVQRMAQGQDSIQKLLLNVRNEVIKQRAADMAYIDGSALGQANHTHGAARPSMRLAATSMRLTTRLTASRHNSFKEVDLSA